MVVASSAGKAIIFPENDVRVMGRQAQGVRAIRLDENETVVGIGRSGQAYSFAENGPERISPLSGGGGTVIVPNETRIRGRDILISWKAERIIDRKRGGNV